MEYILKHHIISFKKNKNIHKLYRINEYKY